MSRSDLASSSPGSSFTRRRDPARPPAVVELLALAIVLALIAGINAWDARASAPSADVGTPSSDEASATGRSAASATAVDTSLAAPAPAGPVDLSEYGLVPVLERVPTQDGVVFVTIDDGLVRDPAALEFLDRHSIPFTSFVTVPLAREGADFWHEHRELGGTIQAHTFDHLDLTTLAPEPRYREICGTHDAFGELFGDQPRLFRPPFGTHDDAVVGVAGGCGYEAVVLWSASANDGRLEFHGGAPRSGDIILMHWRPDLVENLETLVEVLEDHDLKVGQLEDYLLDGARFPEEHGASMS